MNPRLLRLCALAVVAAAPAGCVLPPPRETPPTLATAAPLDGIPTGTAATWPGDAWWTRYDDAVLNELERRALASAPSLAAARARFDEAVRAVDVARAAGGASVDAQAQVQRERLSEHGLIPTGFLGFTWYGQGDLGATFRYDFDFFGSHGAEIAAAIDRGRAAQAERDAAANLLTAAVAESYFGWQADQARLAAARDRVAALDEARTIAAARVARGVDVDDVAQRAEADLAAAKEDAAAIEWSAHLHRAAIAALLGVAETGLPEFTPRPLPAATAALPADAGLDLVAHRADVAASRWRVEAALRDVDVARAAFFPDLSLTAMLGLSSIDLDKLLTAGSRVAAAGPALHLPIFDAGRLHARFGASQAALARAIADYNQAVVDAARDAAGQALTLLQVQARRREHEAALAAATRLQAAAQARVRQGVADARPALVATAELARQRDADIQLATAALAAEIGLTRALGGGYRPAPAEPAALANGGSPQ